MGFLTAFAERLLFQKDARFICAPHASSRFNIEIPAGYWAYFLGFDFQAPEPFEDEGVTYSIIVSNKEQTLAFVNKTPLNPITTPGAGGMTQNDIANYPLYLRSRTDLGFTVMREEGYNAANNVRVNAPFWSFPPFKNTFAPLMDNAVAETVLYEFPPSPQGPIYLYAPFGEQFTNDYLGINTGGVLQMPYFVLGPNLDANIAQPSLTVPVVKWTDWPTCNVYYILVKGNWPDNWERWTRDLVNG